MNPSRLPIAAFWISVALLCGMSSIWGVRQVFDEFWLTIWTVLAVLGVLALIRGFVELAHYLEVWQREVRATRR
jgi:hypothetical protein